MTHEELRLLRTIIREAVEAGIAEARREQDPAADYISQRQAYKEFSIAFVQEAVKSGRVKRLQMGKAANSRMMISRAELLKCLAERNIETCILKHHINKAFGRQDNLLP